ncbi:heme peroxidase [Mycena polygramma]|nr:heme peroxidase [Mycena polygramma]
MLPLTLLTLAGSAGAYVWPSPQLDALESIRWDQAGTNSHGIAGFITPCDSFISGTSANHTGRSNVPDWIRTVYHDMAGYNTADGTGGLDASIRFDEEQARAENIGDGFSNTVVTLLLSSNRYVSIADVLAVGVIIAIENCGGPEIAFRGGRADADKPNAPGVPEPQQDIATHIATFARQGFTQTEMIGLVACGHTFGGVQHVPFPDIVGVLNDSSSTLDVAHFDSTFVAFDNKVATEYVSGTTQNPLVVGFNDTTNSDKRIFGSDGNVTMHSFAKSPKVFAATCADLFARMLNTVPKGVQLTDVVQPLPVKPTNLELVLSNDTIHVSGQVRFWNMTKAHSVSVLWDDHNGKNNAKNKASMAFAGLSTAAAGRYSAGWYNFTSTSSSSTTTTTTSTSSSNPLTIPAAAGITSLRFLVDNTLHDQNGAGFFVQDAFMLSASSCITTVNANNFPTAARVDVAVRKGAGVSRVYLEHAGRDGVQRPTVVEIDVPAPNANSTSNLTANSTSNLTDAKSSSAYEMWSLQNVTGAVASFTIGAEVDGVKYSTSNANFFFALPRCAS